MPKVSIKICSTLHTILQDESFNNFKVVQLRDRFVAESTNNQSVSVSYNFIYRQINKLVKKGALRKIDNKKTKTNTYQKTETFKQLNFVIKEVDKEIISEEKQQDTIGSHTVNQLKERLKQTEVDLLTSIGESEEYMRLYKSFPEMKGHLESQYMLARENSSKLLGQIKAIKSVLTYQQK